jgi:trimeric autotransporter adhesin
MQSIIQPQQKLKAKNMTTIHLTKSIGRLPMRRGFLLIPLALASFALSPNPNAFGVSPAPDGGSLNNNTAEGTNALFKLTTGIDNTADGFSALYFSTSANYSTATGFQALYANTTGSQNTATGYQALARNTTASHNTADGGQALFSNTLGTENTSVGFKSLYSNTGSYNTSIGSQSLYHNTSGTNNTADGYQALASNTLGSNSTAVGYQALGHNTGSENTAMGASALVSNTVGTDNTAVGGTALWANTGGVNNAAFGLNALVHNTTGSNNTSIGKDSGNNLTTGSYNITIGATGGVAGESYTTRIGGNATRVFIAGIAGKPITGQAVTINTSGQLGVNTSSRRFKDEIKPMGDVSDALLELKPVTFHYKKEIDPDSTPQFGLVAEEVEKVNPDLVSRDAKGKAYTVRYDAVNAMLLNEFLKEHREVQEQKATITQLKSTVAQQQKDFQSKLVQQQKDFQATAAHQQKQIEALSASLQKVSAQVEMSRRAPQTVLNNH